MDDKRIFGLVLLGLYTVGVHGEKPLYTHWPERFRIIPETANETEYKVHGKETPDWRIEETPPSPYWRDWYKEMGRPYRLSPFEKQAYRWNRAYSRLPPRFEIANWDDVYKLGCYCCTVYRRLTPLGVCAVITTRHVLTTATSTELILKDYDQEDNLEDILGFWYDRGSWVQNSSMYASVSRIHYHPRYIMPNNVNASHPLPSTFDLAVWASTYPFLGSWISSNRAFICNRAGAHTFDYSGPIFTHHVAMVVGYQFMVYYKRVPMPWYKYVIRTREIMQTCPKSEWGWFFCLYGKWAQLGLDSGCVLHRNRRGSGWKYDGLIGMNSFSMTLRARTMTHYFTVLDNYSVMEFLYDSYMGTIDYRYLDQRFLDTKWKAPVSKEWHYIPWKYDYGDEYAWVDKNPSWFK